jgi:hypothetical protein
VIASGTKTNKPASSQRRTAAISRLCQMKTMKQGPRPLAQRWARVQRLHWQLWSLARQKSQRAPLHPWLAHLSRHRESLSRTSRSL